ncbi:MAG TPA: TRAP transporter small permease [Ramlibacter sp.]|nr:TRAP transporter small permease [Ramlibacter sp.]
MALLAGAGGWLRKRAENVAVILIATMFASFIIQIVARYVFNRPFAWTEELSVLCWLWVVLWGAAFVLTDSEEVRFDIIYGIVPNNVRRAFTLITGVALIVLYAISLPASWKYVAFMHREHSAYLRIPFNILYSIFIIFAVASIVRHAWLMRDAIRGTVPPPLEAASGGDPS